MIDESIQDITQPIPISSVIVIITCDQQTIYQKIRLYILHFDEWLANVRTLTKSISTPTNKSERFVCDQVSVYENVQLTEECILQENKPK